MDQLIDRSTDIWSNEKFYSPLYEKEGLKIYLNGAPGKIYRIRIQVDPCRVLGKDSTALFSSAKEEYDLLKKRCSRMLKKIKVPCSIDEMKISRCDVRLI